MRQIELDKRTTLITGSDLNKKPMPKESGRRGAQHVYSEPDEYDATYNDFFEFQKDLDEIEASNELIKRASIYEEPEQPTVDLETNKMTYFIIMEEEEEDEVLKFKNASPIIMDDYEDIDTKIEFKSCAFIKGGGESCKRQAPKNNIFCSAHRKK